MKNLIIVESPNKIKSIENYLGKDYKVLASVGHIYHLSTSGKGGLGIELDTWEPLWEVDPKKKKVVRELKSNIKDYDEIFIATDPDREGEAIAANLVEVLKIEKKYKRIRFNEITKSAIKASIDNAFTNGADTKIDSDLVNAQITRRLLDRIIGFKLSKLMRVKMSGYPAKPSAGRVQSIALKLIIERENLIDAFIPYKYFKIFAKINDEMLLPYINVSKKENKDWIELSKVDKIYDSLKGPLVVKDISERIKKDKKYIPLKQAMLYRICDTQASISSARVQSAAQKLYEGFNEKDGLITYPRTDSSRFSKTFIKHAKEYILGEYGDKYWDSNIKDKKGDQDAHEAIRPTNLAITPEIAKEEFGLNSYEYKVYSIIYSYTIKCLMTQPERINILYKLENNSHEFRASTFKIKFDGYYAASKLPVPKMVPNFKVGDSISVQEYIKEKNQTSPPARFTEGMLIDKLDEIGVGRPSTFSTVIKTNKDRLYLLKEGKSLVPTKFGKIVVSKLDTYFSKIMSYEYTSNIEKEFNEVAKGQLEHKKILKEFYDKFELEIKDVYEKMVFEKLAPEPIGKKCPDSDEDLVFRVSKKGDRFIACSGFPKCKYTASIERKIIKKIKKI